ncbi:hypothetical protein BDW22DRAFT_1342836 [Trametopsis cervina]|nr:hypothetical protein BDW22DRAFT_1342836 [Trametopsis cervina]
MANVLKPVKCLEHLCGGLKATEQDFGIHQRGDFNEVRKIDFEAAGMKAAAEAAQPVLKKLGRLLDEILYIVLEHGQEGRFSVVCRGGELKMYQRKDEETFIPDDILARFG